MLICNEGHRTEVHVHMTNGTETVYSGIVTDSQLQGILAALEEGSCPVCAVLDAGQ